MWHWNIFHKFALMWLLGVFFESVLCSTHDVHRVILKTHHRSNRERDNHRYHPEYRQKRKPPVYELDKDNLPSETVKNPNYYYNNYRLDSKNEKENEYKRGKPRNFSTAKPSKPSLHVELTTAFAEKLPLPVIESTFHNYFRPPFNNSLDSYVFSDAKQEQSGNSSAKARQLREKEMTTPRNVSKGYEVYEEIIEDTTPPPYPSLLLNHLQNLPVVETPSPVVTQNSVESQVTGNVSEFSENGNRTHGRTTKPRRNRGSVKFE